MKTPTPTRKLKPSRASILACLGATDTRILFSTLPERRPAASHPQRMGTLANPKAYTLSEIVAAMSANLQRRVLRAHGLSFERLDKAARADVLTGGRGTGASPHLRGRTAQRLSTLSVKALQQRAIALTGRPHPNMKKEDLIALVRRRPRRAQKACRDRSLANRPGEKWKAIPTEVATRDGNLLPVATGYEVSSDGRVKSLRGPWPKILKPNESRFIVKLGKRASRYLSFQLSSGEPGKCVSVLAHRLVLLAFRPKTDARYDGFDACHRNDVADDNRLVNLHWGTREENHADRRRLARPRRSAGALGSRLRATPEVVAASKRIKDAQRYSITNEGQVLSRRGNESWILAHKPASDGYHYVTIHFDDGTWRRLSVHRLVLREFCGEPAAGMTIVRHLDDNRSNNRLENLAYGTPLDNGADARANHKCRAINRKSAIAPDTVRLIIEDECSQSEAACKYGISQNSVKHIRKRTSYEYVDATPPPNGYRDGRKARTGSQHPNRKLDAELARTAFLDPRPARDVCAIFRQRYDIRVSTSTIENIRNGKFYGDVTRDLTAPVRCGRWGGRGQLS